MFDYRFTYGGGYADLKVYILIELKASSDIKAGLKAGAVIGSIPCPFTSGWHLEEGARHESHKKTQSQG